MPKIVDHDTRRLEIATAAIETIAERGLSASTLAHIADEVGCTTGLLRHYFRSKDDLIAFTVGTVTDRSTERIATAAANGTGLAAIRNVLAELLPLDRARHLEWRLWLALWADLPAHPDVVESQQPMYESLRTVIGLLARETNGLRNMPTTELDDRVDQLVLGSLGIGLRAAIDPTSLTAERQLRLLDLLTQTLPSEASHAANPGVVREAQPDVL